MPATDNHRRFIAAVLMLVLGLSCARNPEVAKREYLASGDQFFSQKKIKEAIVQYRNAVRQDPRFGEARYKLAEAYVLDGDAARAPREYIRAADLLPKDFLAQLKSSDALLLSLHF